MALCSHPASSWFIQHQSNCLLNHLTENLVWMNLNHFQGSSTRYRLPQRLSDTSTRLAFLASARHVSAHEGFGVAGCLVKPSANPSPSTSVGLLLHMGHSLLRSCEALIQTMRFQRWPEEMGRAPCMCWPRWRSPSHTLCSTSEHSVSLKGTCRGRHDQHLQMGLNISACKLFHRSHNILTVAAFSSNSFE